MSRSVNRAKNRRVTTLSVLVVAIAAGVVWGVDWGGHEPAPVGTPDAVPEVDVSEEKVWMEQLESPGSVVFRERVGATANKSDELAAVTVTTFGPLPDWSRDIARDDFGIQLKGLQRKIDAVPANASEAAGRTDDLKFALDAAELLLSKARLEVVVDMLERGDYATIRLDAPRPPRVDGYDRVVHGPMPGPDGKDLELVFFVDHGSASYTEASEFRSTIYWEYWRAFVGDFNGRPLAERQARIALHDRAQDQRTGVPVEEELSPAELQAAVFVGPVLVDRERHLLSLRN